ncbi:MAG: hypothetical protein LBD53_10155 [Tannerella sp.]|jgi:hypothetical protein|nr:hypothetical protein [Tannerella sp.]
MYKTDINKLKEYLPQLPKSWDGKSCILELQDADYNWKQMEWCGWYFEFKVRQILADKFEFPGDKFNNVTFDLKGTINWDIKAKFLNADEYMCLNDKEAIEQTIQLYGCYGVLVAYLIYDYKNHNATLECVYSYLFDRQDLIKLDVLSMFQGKDIKYLMNIDYEHLFNNYKIVA